MPTQEEKLTALEQTTKEHIKENAKALRQANEHLTMTIGLVQRQSFVISEINNRLDTMQENFSTHFEATTAHLELLQNNADTTNKALKELKQDLAEVKATLAQILERLPEKH